MKKILVIANPAAARGGVVKSLEKVRKLVRSHEPDVSFDFVVTDNPNHATNLAKVHAGEYDIVAAMGGDGTINEVAQAMVGSEQPFGVIPHGTGNDFVRSIGIPRDHRKAVELLCHGRTKRVDLGRVNGRFFVNAMGIGFDGRANYESLTVNPRWGPLIIPIAILRTLRFWKSTTMTMIINGETIRQPTYLIGIGNGWSVGGGLQLTPQAVLDDELLDVTHVGDISRLKIIFNLWRLKNGSLGELAEVSLHRSNKISISSDHPLPVHVDGEVLGLDVKQLDIQLFPAALNVICLPA